MPYLRPTSIPAGRVPYLVCLPDTSQWRTQFWGAIADLTDSWRWEGTSSLTDDEISSVWVEVLNSFRRAEILMAGHIVLYPSGTIPDGWLLCDGAGYDPDDYPALFEVIGYSFGGSGSTFYVPELIDKFVAGAGGDYDVGYEAGANSVQLAENQMPQHHHTTHTHGTGVAVTPGELPVTLPGIGSEYTGYAGSANSHENRPPFMAMSMIISTGQIC
jgi:microcystin-dependent protein